LTDQGLRWKYDSEDYTNGEYHFPLLSVSASKNNEGEINITVANVSPGKDLQTSIELNGFENFKVNKSELITSDKINSYNDFGKVEEVYISEFNDFVKDGNNIKVTIPSKSVMLINLK